MPTPGEPASLSVLSWAGRWGWALREAVSGPFERQTGIRVEHRTHVGLKLPDALLSALAQGASPPVDLVWSNSVPALRAARAGFCDPLDPAQMPVLAELRPRARPATAGPSDRLWPVVHPYVVYYVLVYREDACPGGPPPSWDVLLDPRHRGKIALYPGGNGFYPIAQVMAGGRVEDIPANMEPCWSYLRKLRPQIGELDYSIGMEERLRSGALELCFRALSNALAFRAADLPVNWSIPREGTTDTVDALWIPKGVSERAREFARRYIAFALQPDVQQHWGECLGAMPVHPGAQIPTLFRGRADLPEHADDHRGILRLSEHLKVEFEPEWEARFRQIFHG